MSQKIQEQAKERTTHSGVNLLGLPDGTQERINEQLKRDIEQYKQRFGVGA